MKNTHSNKNKINKLTMDQSVNILLAIDNVYTVF